MTPLSPGCTINDLLHEDTLHHIFTMAITDEHDVEERFAMRWLDDVGDPLLPPYPHWHFSEVVSEVCRWWRWIALRAPEMWTKLRLDIHHPPERTQRWLSRTRDAPLVVVLRGDSKSPRPQKCDAIIPFFTQVSEHLARIADLTVDICGLGELLEIQSQVIQPLHKLGHLRSMRVRSLLRYPYQMVLYGITLIEPSTSPHPDLKTLVLHRCSLDWEWPVRNLRVLKLVHNRYIKGPTRQHLQAVLEASPHLEELALDNFAESTPPIADHSQKVVLPHLYTLQIRSSSTFVQWLLGLIETSPRLKSLIVETLSLEMTSRLSSTSTLHFLGLISSGDPLSFAESLEPICGSTFHLLEEVIICPSWRTAELLHHAALSVVRESPMLRRLTLSGLPNDVTKGLCEAVEVRNRRGELRPLEHLVTDLMIPPIFRLEALGVQVQILSSVEMRRMSNCFPLSFEF